MMIATNTTLQCDGCGGCTCNSPGNSETGGGGGGGGGGEGGGCREISGVSSGIGW